MQFNLYMFPNSIHINYLHHTSCLLYYAHFVRIDFFLVLNNRQIDSNQNYKGLDVLASYPHTIQRFMRTSFSQVYSHLSLPIYLTLTTLNLQTFCLTRQA